MLPEALLHAKPYDPIFVNEYAPSDKKRRNECGRVCCEVVRYSYTGRNGPISTSCLWKVNLDDSETDLLQKNDRIKETLKKEFPVYRSRSMRKEFIQHLGRATGIKSGILREAYREWTGDQSAPNTLSDLVWDLRVMNSGRSEQYSDFLTRCQEFVKAKVETAVDDRRHDQVDEDGRQAITHLAMAMSARDLHEQVAIKSAQR